MAGPMVHGGVTLPISIIAFLIVGWQWSSQIPIWFLGVFIDFFDHFSFRRLEKLLRGEKEPITDWICWMHTWWALGGVIIFCFLMKDWLPFVPFLIHNFIDAGNKNIADIKAEPLPVFLHRFFPQRWQYTTNTETSVLAEMFSWPQKIKKFLRRKE